MKEHRQKHPLVFGTLILTGAGLFTRAAGFFYRIFLSHKITTAALGLYQMVYPLYSICFSLCCGAIQTSLSRFVAAEYRKRGGGESRRFLAAGLALSLSFSLLAALALFSGAPLLAARLLAEPRAAALIRVMALSVPVSAVHCCICGYYYGQGRAELPASAQLMEQAARIFSVVFAVRMAEASGRSATALYAAGGHLAGELGALFLSLSVFACESLKGIKKTRRTSSARKSCGFLMSSILSMALPLAANRLVISLLQSAEAVLIPGSLRAFGLSGEEALSLYGILTGMALPFIFFPTALTGSLSVMLLPHIAAAQSEASYESISRSSRLSIRFSLYVGVLAAGLFLRFGASIGPAVFHNETAGELLTVLAWLCPFLYVSGTLGSIINGLGYVKVTFLHNVLSLGIRLAFVTLMIPRIGMRGYLYGLLASELFVTSCHYAFLRRKTALALSPVYELLRPLLAAFAGTGFSFLASAMKGLPGLMVSGALYVAGYLWVLYFTRR